MLIYINYTFTSTIHANVVANAPRLSGVVVKLVGVAILDYCYTLVISVHLQS